MGIKGLNSSPGARPSPRSSRRRAGCCLPASAHHPFPKGTPRGAVPPASLPVSSGRARAQLVYAATNSPACKQSAQSLPREEQCFPAALQHGLSYHTQRCQGKAGPFPDNPSASAKQKAKALPRHSLRRDGCLSWQGKRGSAHAISPVDLGSVLRSLCPSVLLCWQQTAGAVKKPIQELVLQRQGLQ